MTTRKLEVQGHAVTLTDAGQGRPVLLLHGNPDSRHLWDKVVPLVAPSMRCIAPDLPGFGDSTVEAPEFDPSLDGMARWVDAVVGASGVETPLDLVVHDFGGIFGLAWACSHPGKVRRIIVTNTLFHEDYRWHFWARVWRAPLLGESSMVLLGVPLLGRLTFAVSLRVGAPTLPWSELWEGSRHFVPRTRRMVLHIYRATDPENFAGWERRFLELAARIPVAVLWGEHDPYIPTSFARRFGTQKVRVLSDVGHWVALEAPETLAALMREHFA